LSSSSVFADQAAYDPAALDPASHIDGAARFMLRGPLVQRLVGPVAVVMPHILSKHLPEMLLTEDQHVIRALAAKRAHEPLCK
jgi:hypothetical protein